MVGRIDPLRSYVRQIMGEVEILGREWNHDE